MNIPDPELRKTEKKCKLLAEIQESFQHVIYDLERRYGAVVRAQMIRPVVGGGAAEEKVVLTEVERDSSCRNTDTDPPVSQQAR